MQSSLFTTLLILVFNLSFSQTSKSVKIFLDADKNETTESNHEFYRIIRGYYEVKEEYIVKEYNKFGVLQMTATTKDKNNLYKNAQFIHYYENGNKSFQLSYSDSKPSGKHFNWHENGQIKSEFEYLDYTNHESPRYKINQFWDRNGVHKVIDGNGEYEIKTDDFWETGKLLNGLRQGIWTGAYKSNKLSFEEKYNKDKLLIGISTDSLNTKHKYKSVYTSPEPKMGMDHFNNYISSHFNFPKDFKINKGTISLQFYIDNAGKISEIKTIKSLIEPLDKEAIRVISSYENWIPATERGINVRSTAIIIPIVLKDRIIDIIVESPFPLYGRLQGREHKN